MEPTGQHSRAAFRPCPLPLRDLTVPPPGQVHLWFLALDRLGSPLHGGEAQAPVVLASRQLRAVRRFYLRLLLGSYLEMPGKDVAILRGGKGKPVLDPASHVEELEFSVAASGDCCLIGVASQGPLGVDLELSSRRSKNPLALARRYFSAEEYAALRKMRADELHRAFLHAWACKEAVVKAAGHGIANRLNRFTVNVHPDEPPAVLAMDDDDATAWRLVVVQPHPRYCGAVALRHAGLALECFSLDPPRIDG